MHACTYSGERLHGHTHTQARRSLRGSAHYLRLIVTLYAFQVWYWETAKAPEGTDIIFMPSIPYKYGSNRDLLQAAGQDLDASVVLKVPCPSDVSHRM